MDHRHVTYGSIASIWGLEVARCEVSSPTVLERFSDPLAFAIITLSLGLLTTGS